MGEWGGVALPLQCCSQCVPCWPSVRTACTYCPYCSCVLLVRIARTVHTAWVCVLLYVLLAARATHGACGKTMLLGYLDNIIDAMPLQYPDGGVVGPCTNRAWLWPCHHVPQTLQLLHVSPLLLAKPRAAASLKNLTAWLQLPMSSECLGGQLVVIMLDVGSHLGNH